MMPPVLRSLRNRFFRGVLVGKHYHGLRGVVRRTTTTTIRVYTPCTKAGNVFSFHTWILPTSTAHNSLINLLFRGNQLEFSTYHICYIQTNFRSPFLETSSNHSVLNIAKCNKVLASRHWIMYCLSYRRLFEKKRLSMWLPCNVYLVGSSISSNLEALERNDCVIQNDLLGHTQLLNSFALETNYSIFEQVRTNSKVGPFYNNCELTTSLSWFDG